MDLEKIGKFISKMRKEKKLTQEELAESLGINNRTISRWENGRNMPDISLYRPLCKILGISIEELINGEKTDKNFLHLSVEKAIINTINSSEKSKKKLNKLVRFLLLIIVAISSVIIILLNYYENKYPKIEIYNMNIIKSDKKTFNDNMTLNIGEDKILFYGVESLQVSDKDNNYFDLKSALKYKQVNMDDVKDYLKEQYDVGNLKRFILSDGGTTIYTNQKYEIILCNTIDGNNDIYIGTPNFEKNLNNEYCGKTKSDICYYTRTYHIISIFETNEKDFVKVSLEDSNANRDTVIVNNTNNIKAGKDYEFIFTTNEIFDDTIKNIFEKSTLIEINETDKLGKEQINEQICVNKT